MHVLIQEQLEKRSNNKTATHTGTEVTILTEAAVTSGMPTLYRWVPDIHKPMHRH